MNGKMWLHPATQQNVATLKGRGAEFIGPEEGMLSCGYEGIGRLWPVDKVAERAVELLGLKCVAQSIRRCHDSFDEILLIH